MPGKGISTGFSASTQGGAPRATPGTISLQKQTKETKEGETWQGERCGAFGLTACVRVLAHGHQRGRGLAPRTKSATVAAKVQNPGLGSEVRSTRKSETREPTAKLQNRRNNAQESQKDRSIPFPFCDFVHFRGQFCNYLPKIRSIQCRVWESRRTGIPSCNPGLRSTRYPGNHFITEANQGNEGGRDLAI